MYSSKYITRQRATNPTFKAKHNAGIGKRKAERKKTEPEYRDKCNARVNMLRLRRRKADPLCHFKDNMRSLIQQSFKGRGLKKNSRTIQILGCDVESAMKHMGWFPGCQIHHIVFMETAKTKEDVVRLNHYTNLIALTKEQHKALHRGVFELLIDRGTRLVV